MKAGNKSVAEHHGMQRGFQSWKSDKTKPGEVPKGDPELGNGPNRKRRRSRRRMKFPDMPWKKKV